MTDLSQEFHAHIYYEPESRAFADSLKQRLAIKFADAQIWIGRLVDRLVGPHTLPMFEINFRKGQVESVTHWLEQERNGHTVLVHPVTGNDLADHTIHARWLGSPLQLDLSKLSD